MSIELVGNYLVNTETGEIQTPIYEAVKPFVSAEEKRWYSATSRCAEECTDPDQLKDFVKATQDMRGITLVSAVTWLKKESDYNVRTLKQKPMLTNVQYKLLEKLVHCISYKNIILCKRSELAQKLDTTPDHLKRKLKTVAQWYREGEAKKGYIKLFVAPWLAYKGSYIKRDKSLDHYYTLPMVLECEEQEYAPIQVQWSRAALKEFERLQEKYSSRSSAPWWWREPKTYILSNGKESKEEYDVPYEMWFVKAYYTDDKVFESKSLKARYMEAMNFYFNSGVQGLHLPEHMVDFATYKAWKEKPVRLNVEGV